MNYDAFISYRHTPVDMAVAGRLHRLLETYRVPAPLVRQGVARQIGRVFRDREELPTSSNLSANIDEALNNSRWLIVICTPRTPLSEWVAKEIHTFQALGRGDRIIAVLVEGDEQSSFPGPLREQPGVPVIDIRAGGLRQTLRRLNQAKLDILPALLGCAAADLKLRDRERAVRQEVLAAAAALLFVTAFVGANAYLWLQANRAEALAVAERDRQAEETRRAVARQSEAEASEAEAQQQERIAQEKRTEATEQRNRAETKELEAREQAERAAAMQAEAGRQRGIALTERDRALERRALMVLDFARRETEAHRGTTGALLALEALPRAEAPNPYLREVTVALGRALYQPREQTVFTGHTNEVNTAAISPDGRRIVTGSDDNTARVWDVATGKTLLVLSGHHWYVSEVAYSADGRRILTASWDGSAGVWDAQTGELIDALEDLPDYADWAALSPDGTKVLSIAEDNVNSVALHTVGSDKPGQVLAGHTDSIALASFSADGRYILTSAWDRTARLWSAGTGAQLAVFPDPTDAPEKNVPFTLTAITNDSRRVAVSYSDYSIGIWDTVTAKELKRTEINEHYYLTGLAFSPDGRHLYACTGYDVQIYDVETGTKVGALESDGRGLMGWLYVSPDGRRVMALDDLTIRVWDTASRKTVAMLSGSRREIGQIGFSPDSSMVFMSSGDGTARVWNLEKGWDMLPLPGHAGELSGGAFSPNGRRVATASADGTVRLWDAATGRPGPVFTGSAGPVHGLAWCPDSRCVAAAMDDGTVRVWAPETGEAVTLPAGSSPVTSVAFDAAADRIVAGAADGTVRVWDLVKGSASALPAASKAAVTRTVFSPDGKLLAAAFADGTAVVAGAGSTVRVDGRTIAFSADGLRVVTAAGDQTVRLWDAATGRQTGALAVKSPVMDAVFSPDGQRVVAACADGTARVIELATGAEVAVLEGHTGAVVTVQFSPDGHYLVTASADGDARLWRYFASLDDLVAHAKATLGRELTPDERKLFLLDVE